MNVFFCFFLCLVLKKMIMFLLFGLEENDLFKYVLEENV